jgi:maleate isomerase
MGSLSTRTRGIPVIATCAASVSALSSLGVRRVALFDPPWFDEALNQLGAEYYGSAGFDVVATHRCDLPSDQGAIMPDDLHAWVSSHTPDRAEAVVIDGNGFRAVGVISALERDLDRPVITANQVLLWASLRAARADAGDVLGYGRIFGLNDGAA